MGWSHFTCLILLSLLFLWTKCSRRTGKSKTIYHFTYFSSFVWVFNIFLFNMWSAEKWSFLLHFYNLDNPSSVASDGHLVSEMFVLPTIFCWGGLELTCGILHSQFFLLFSELEESVQSWNQVRLWSCFPMISVVIPQCRYVCLSLQM